MGKVRTITQFLEQYDWYLKLRFSILHNLNLSLRYPRQYQAIQKENRLYIRLLQDLPTNSPLIFDIGANIGQLTQAFLNSGARQVIAVEPDSQSIRILRSRFGNNNKVTIIDKALSNKVTKLPFYQQKGGGALSTLNLKWRDLLLSKAIGRSFGNITFEEKPKMIETTMLDLLIDQYGLPDLVKIDVEGHELEVLQGLSQVVPLIAFEANLPEFLTETIKCLEYLEELSSNIQFQYSQGDTFQLSPILDTLGIIKFVQQTPYRYLDIFAFSISEK